MERELAKITKDVEHVKETMEEIKENISSFFKQSTKTVVEIEQLRGRVNELEHKQKDIEKRLAELNEADKKQGNMIVKILLYLASFGGGIGATLGIEHWGK